MLFNHCKALLDISIPKINESIFSPLPETFFKNDNKARIWQHKPDASSGQSKLAALGSQLTKNITTGRGSWSYIIN